MESISKDATILDERLEDLFPDSIVDGRYVVYNGEVSYRKLNGKEVIFTPMCEIIAQYYLFDMHKHKLSEKQNAVDIPCHGFRKPGKNSGNTITTTLKMTLYGKIRNVVDTITMAWDAFELKLLSKDITRRSKRIEKKLDKTLEQGIEFNSETISWEDVKIQ